MTFCNAVERHSWKIKAYRVVFQVDLELNPELSDEIDIIRHNQGRNRLIILIISIQVIQSQLFIDF